MLSHQVEPPTMIKLLVFSDIHNNILAVKSLRDQENNEYDAIIVAGDVGNYIWPGILSIIETFECPAYFVYGNWDNRQPYTRQLSSNGILLNHTIEFHKGFFFTGFSGCETHWGMNPFYEEQVALLKEEYRDVIEIHQKEVERVHQKREEELIRVTSLKKSIERVYTKNRKKIKKPTNKKYIKHFNNEVLVLQKWKADELSKILSHDIIAHPSCKYKEYLQKTRAIHGEALQLNRNKLFSLIKQSNIQNNRLIIISHQRLTKISDEKIPAALHIFGHRHEYKFTKLGESYYLNVAQLDSSIGLTGRHGGGYCIVEMDGKNISVERKTLPFLLGSKAGSGYI